MYLKRFKKVLSYNTYEVRNEQAKGQGQTSDEKDKYAIDDCISTNSPCKVNKEQNIKITYSPFKESTRFNKLVFKRYEKSTMEPSIMNQVKTSKEFIEVENNY